MRHKSSHIFFLLAKLPLLLLYVSFFTVQLFYNFDIAARSANTAQFAKHSQHSKNEIVKKASSPSGKKTSFRLNKRYQPQQALVCEPIMIEPIVCCVSSKLHIHYSSGFIPASLPTAKSLRGPPSVV